MGIFNWLSTDLETARTFMEREEFKKLLTSGNIVPIEKIFYDCLKINQSLLIIKKVSEITENGGSKPFKTGYYSTPKRIVRKFNSFDNFGAVRSNMEVITLQGFENASCRFHEKRNGNQTLQLVFSRVSTTSGKDLTFMLKIGAINSTAVNGFKKIFLEKIKAYNQTQAEKNSKEVIST